MLENNEELMTPIMTHIKYRHFEMMTFRCNMRTEEFRTVSGMRFILFTPIK